MREMTHSVYCFISRLPTRLLTAVLTTAITLNGMPSSASAATGIPKVPSPALQHWVLGGYFPTNPNQKIYLQIDGRQISQLLPGKPSNPQALVLDTDAIIFPGLIDMHNHMEDGFLGLWDTARGEYRNRFEWRGNAQYRLAVKSNEAAFTNERATCAAYRWAELKALVGGTTAMQGVGSHKNCVQDFGINNVEITNEFGLNQPDIGANLELVNPGNVQRVFNPLILPRMQQGMTYDQALRAALDQTGTSAWMQEFRTATHDLRTGIHLTVGEDIGASNATDLNVASHEFDTVLAPKILNTVANLKDGDGKLIYQSASAQQSALAAVHLFLFGPSNGPGAFIGSRLPPNPADVQKMTINFLTQGGVLRLGSIKRYYTMFENSLKNASAGALESGKSIAYITHMAEGTRSDPFNRAEFRVGRDMGLLVPGMVLIHAVGMHVDNGVDPARANEMQSDFVYARNHHVSLVWSPFSNLLLYGQTLDIAEAIASGLNVSLGCDWSPTGSKNILDELKIARDVIDNAFRNASTPRARAALASLDDEALVNMVTKNPARALGMLDHPGQPNRIGQVAPGFQADLTLISRDALARVTGSPKPAYSALVHAEHNDVSLVVVKGQPLYGDRPLLGQVARFVGEPAPETLPTGSRRFGADCPFQKGIRFPFTSAYDLGISNGPRLRSVAEIEGYLVQTLAMNQAIGPDPKKQIAERFRAPLDALFKCEENRATQYGSRFDGFVQNEVPQNAAKRAALRNQLQLKDNAPVVDDVAN